MNAALITITPEAEALMAYIARVSSPHQENPEYEKLLKYCIDHQHWSVFEQAHMTVEIETSRMVSAQILRHRSFTFQEFSQRYSEAFDYEPCDARRQDTKNRQNSIDDLSDEVKEQWRTVQRELFTKALDAYHSALDMGIAKECARAVLPMSTKTKLYMTGNIRNWIHYIQLRTGPDTQLEHRQLAQVIRSIFIRELPTVSKALGWEDL